MTVPFTVVGWGAHHPPHIVTNLDLEARLDTSDAWIRERTGIESRHVGGTTGGSATEAGRIALQRWGGDPTTIGLVVLATSTPDEVIPATAVRVAGNLGLRCGAFDVNAACAGFAVGLVAAAGFLATGVDRVLLIGADTMSSITDPDDRSTAILFGDGAGAVLLERGGAGGLLGHDEGSDPSTHDLLRCATGERVTMDGQAVFKVAVRAAVSSAERALAAAGLDPGAVDLFVPHQANARITDAIAKRMGWGADTVVSTIARTANTSAATIPAALAAAADDGRIAEGATVLISGFGAGMSWATVVFRWSTPTGATATATGPHDGPGGA